jgi:membrane protein YdbS with pleckstrin-like domain
VVSAPDPILERRARIARYVKIAQRIGYLALAVAVVAFIISFVTDFPSWSVTLTIVCLVLAIVILPIPIVFGYGVRAAEREERQGRAA